MADIPYESLFGGVPVPSPKLSDFDDETLRKMLQGQVKNPGFPSYQINNELFKRKTATPLSPIGTGGADIYGRGPGEETKEAVPSFRGPQPPQEIKTPTPSQAAATPTPQTPPDPFQSIRDRLFQGGGGGKMPSIPRVDSKEITKNIPQISERKPEETYKADPYMTMLQTGLRILSAKPEIGQSAISQIAGGVGAGVADYRAEKEKEKQSKREEAREARAEEYRRAEAARSTAGLDMQVATLNQNAAIAEAKMKQEAAQHGQSADLRRLELAVNIEDKKADNLLRKQIAAQSDPNEILKMAKPFEDRLEALRKEFQENKDPMRREVLKGQIDRTERDITTIRRFSVAREGASDERNKYQLLGRLRGELTKLQGTPTADPATVQNTMQQIRRLEDELGLQSTIAPASLPPPPR